MTPDQEIRAAAAAIVFRDGVPLKPAEYADDYVLALGDWLETGTVRAALREVERYIREGL